MKTRIPALRGHLDFGEVPALLVFEVGAVPLHVQDVAAVLVTIRCDGVIDFWEEVAELHLVVGDGVATPRRA